MHPIFFGLKRAHHASLSVSRPLLRPFDLTPARFDMMCALAQHVGLTQTDLANILGVKPPTVSRMVKALLQLGLVEKTGADDLRLRYVHLTDLGEALLEEALHAIVSSGAAELAGRIAASWSHSERSVQHHLQRFQRHLRWVRYAFGDLAIRFRTYGDVHNPSLRRPLALLEQPPHLKDQLWAAA